MNSHLLAAHRADVGYYPTQKKNLKSGTSDVPENEERVGAYEYVTHKRYTRPMVIRNTRSVAFPYIFCRRQEKKEGMLEKEKKAKSLKQTLKN